MDLQGLAHSVAGTVNSNVTVTVKVSTGFATGAGQRQVPTYADPVTGLAQIQAMSAADLRQVENLNIQGTMRAIYLRGELAGVVRPENKGGDLILEGSRTWLVRQVLESWPTWTKAAIVLQGS